MKQNLLVVTLFVAGVSCTHIARAQSAGGEGLRWGVGVTTTLLGAPVGTTLLGLSVSRDVALLGPLTVRVEAAGSAAASHERQICDFGSCDSRSVGRILEAQLGATWAIFNRPGQGSPFISAAVGAYTSRWGSGESTPSAGTVPATPGSGSGPAGGLLTAGVGWQTNGWGRSFDFGLQVHNLLAFPKGTAGAVTAGVNTRW